MKNVFFVFFWLLAILQSVVILLQPVTWITIPFVQDIEQHVLAWVILFIGCAYCLYVLQHKKKTWNYLSLDQNEGGETVIDTNVFVNIAEKILREREEIDRFECRAEVKEKKREKGLSIQIDIIPIMEKEISFGECSKEIKEEIRQAIQKQVPITIQEITITFREEIL